MHDPNLKVLTHKIYQNQIDFLDSNESSLNTSHNSDDAAVIAPPTIKKDVTKMLTKRLNSQIVVEEEEGERDSDRSRDNDRSYDSNGD